MRTIVGITWDCNGAIEHFIAYLGWGKNQCLRLHEILHETHPFSDEIRMLPAESGDESETLRLCGQVCRQLFSFPHESLALAALA